MEKSIRSTEDRVPRARRGDRDGAQPTSTSREKNLPAETEQHEERLKDWRAEQRDDQRRARRAPATRSPSLEAEIPPRDRAEFHRLIDKKHGLAVVLVVGGSCSACHVKVRPAAMQILKQGREIIYCDSCKRILYYEPRARERSRTVDGTRLAPYVVTSRA